MSAAHAYPEGAPWGAANPAAEQNCATCHFDYDAVHDSAALAIEGLPDAPQPGETYELSVTFDEPEAIIAGFQMLAKAGDEKTGVFVSTAPDVEFAGGAIRSTEPLKNDGRISWAIQWRAPATIILPIVIYLAASSANDDGSPFGDVIHFRTFVLPGE